MLFSGLYAQIAKIPAVTSLLGAVSTQQGGGYAIYNGRADKTPAIPFLVLHKIDALPAGQTLSGPSALIDGEIQFDAWAGDLITAQKLTLALLNYFAGSSLALPDGTTIQFTEVTAHMDGEYEEGGEGYLFRSILRLAAMYAEGAATTTGT
jgi:hypothetical protein